MQENEGLITTKEETINKSPFVIENLED